MNAIALLKADHRTVEELFREVEGLSDTAHSSRQRLFKKIDEELTVHSKIEETVFYPAFRERTKRNTAESDEVLEAYEEHANVKAMLVKLEGLEADDDTYNAKLQVLMELVKHHVKEEETKLFKQAEELFNKDELDDLGERLAVAKEKMLAAAQ